MYIQTSHFINMIHPAHSPFPPPPPPPAPLPGVVYGKCEAWIEPGDPGASYDQTAKRAAVARPSEEAGMAGGARNSVRREFFERHRCLGILKKQQKCGTSSWDHYFMCCLPTTHRSRRKRNPISCTENMNKSKKERATQQSTLIDSNKRAR